MEVKDAVVRQDTEYLMRYVSPRGTYFIDNLYTHDEINELIKDKDSWLYRHLFEGNTSVKSYFVNATELEVKIYPQGDDHIFVTYRSLDRQGDRPSDYVECCFSKRGGRWYFDGIFSCD